MRSFGFRRFLLTFGVALALLVPAPGFAQTGPVDVRVYNADHARFPGVCVQVAPLAPDGTIVPELAAAFRVYENGEPRPVTTVSREHFGAQVAVVLDASGSMKLPAVTGGQRRRLDEAVGALDDLILTDKWLQRDQQRDQMLVLAPTGADSLNVVQPWTNVYNAVHNAAYQVQPVDGNTPLYKMLKDAMTQMSQLAGNERMAKFLVVLSDGVDKTSAQEGSDIINLANQLGVKVLSILVGPETAEQSKTLRRLAEESGGGTAGDWSYTDYTGPDSLAPLYRAIQSQAEPYIVCYRSKVGQPTPQELQVGVQLADQEYKSRPFSFRVPVKPALVVVKSPPDGDQIAWTAPAWDTDPAQIQPAALPVEVEVSWPDNFQRTINSVNYEVDGSVVAELGTTEAFTWDISTLADGVHSLRVIVKDELGVDSPSAPTQINIARRFPSKPAPTPTPVPTPQPLKDQILEAVKNPLISGTLLVSLIAVGLALYVLLRKPKVVSNMATTVVDAVRDATIVFRPRSSGADMRPAGATLLPILDDAGTPGTPIPIHSQSVTIGRDPARAQVVFSDRSVSRLHARLVEEADGVFVLHDEGSASGTYVNGERVDMQPRVLKDGDSIEFGRQKVTFQGGAPGTQTVTKTEGFGDETEPFVPQR
jgi:pSer/pThr/pTyr-binding forkhead associated (FHA) protein/Mg-chelatase subunit ChlD